jgi:hypothetical protein
MILAKFGDIDTGRTQQQLTAARNLSDSSQLDLEERLCAG